MEAAIITTFRCLQKCAMCGIWNHPTEPGEEFGGPFRDFLFWHGIRQIAGRPIGGLPLEIEAGGFDRLRRGVILGANADIADKIRAWEIRAHLRAPEGGRRRSSLPAQRNGR